MNESNQPTHAFIAASWIALAIGLVSYLAGVWNSTMLLNEKGFYFVLVMYGLFAAVSIQKTVRDKQDGIPVTGIYYGISWVSEIIALGMLVIGLWNATLTLSEKGFFAISFVLSLFGAIAVQKNTRDTTKKEKRVNDLV